MGRLGGPADRPSLRRRRCTGPLPGGGRGAPAGRGRGRGGRRDPSRAELSGGRTGPLRPHTPRRPRGFLRRRGRATPEAGAAVRVAPGAGVPRPPAAQGGGSAPLPFAPAPRPLTRPHPASCPGGGRGIRRRSARAAPTPGGGSPARPAREDRDLPAPSTPRPPVPAGPHPAGGTRAHRLRPEPPWCQRPGSASAPAAQARSTCRSVCPGAGAPDAGRPGSAMVSLPGRPATSLLRLLFLGLSTLGECNPARKGPEMGDGVNPTPREVVLGPGVGSGWMGTPASALALLPPPHPGHPCWQRVHTAITLGVDYVWRRRGSGHGWVDLC